MEIGTWNGARAEQMIAAASKFYPVEEITYIGFDLFEEMNTGLYKHEVSKKPPTEEAVRNRLIKTGAQVILRAGYTTKTLRDIEYLPKPDLVFIDGGHEASTVTNDWIGVEKIMHKGTVVIFDDYWHNRKDGPRVVIDNLNRDLYNVRLLPEIDIFFNKDFGKLVISLTEVTKK